MNNNLRLEFYRLASELNKKLNVIPLMYGSFGLEHITSVKIKHSDIDILIPKVFINEKWNELKNVVESLGYRLEDIREHEFRTIRISI